MCLLFYLNDSIKPMSQGYAIELYFDPALENQLCDVIKKEGVEVGDEQCPNTWISYCSVAEEVPKTRMAEAFTVLRDLKMPVSGYRMEMSLVEYSPVRELFSFTLGTHHISDI
ncbi:RNA ligase/cyclic nucleotide phosphodiesterase family protein [Perilla frutescens var. hirtella]|nr:RNA ligase/cyclic nucleotide phosphodiesterase family protein [Perilla frutescens var. hirtella]